MSGRNDLPGYAGATSKPSAGAIGLVGVAFFLVAAVAMFATESDYGVASDVGNYFYGSMRHLAWLGEFTRALADGQPGRVFDHAIMMEHWRWMPTRLVHPPLSREISGASWLLFRDVLDTMTAYRVGVMITFAILTAGVATFTAVSAGSLLSGVGAGLGILTMPVLFAHGHLAHTDLFLAAFWFGSAALLYRWSGSGRPWQLLASGVLLGAALATKFSALLLIPVLGLWVILRRPRDLLHAVLVLGLSAAVVFFISNPLLWSDPVLGLSDYFGAGLNRAEEIRSLIFTEYFGTVYAYRGPWHYPFVWTAIVIPPTILFVILAAAFDRKNRLLVGFCLLNAGIQYAALMLRSAPMHDGVRLFLSAFSFYAVLAGLGTAVVASQVARLIGTVSSGMKPWAPILVVAGVFVPAAAAVVRTHPHQLSYVNFLVGGTGGADERGLEVANLKEVLSEAVLADLQAVLPVNAVIDPGFLLEEFCFNQTLGLAPRSWTIETSWPALREGDPEMNLACRGVLTREPVAVARPVVQADYVVMINRRALWRPIERALGEHGGRPFYRVTLDGAPLLMVYKLR